MEFLKGTFKSQEEFINEMIADELTNLINTEDVEEVILGVRSLDTKENKITYTSVTVAAIITMLIAFQVILMIIIILFGNL
jgi:hypothetical protein